MADNQKIDRSDDIVWIMVAGAIIAIAIWYFFGEEVKYYYLTIKLIQLKIITTVYPTEQYLELLRILEETDFRTFTFQEMLTIGGIVGAIGNIPLIIIITWLSYLSWNKNPLQKFRRQLNMNSLKQSEQSIWPYISPMVNIDLMKEPFNSGTYAMAMRPYDYAVKHKLLKDPKNLTTLNTGFAEKLFASQLGRLFIDLNGLKEYEKALLAIFAAHGCGDKRGAMEAINKIAISSANLNVNKMPDMSSVVPLFKYLDDKRVIEVINKHAYIYTVLAQMLVFARSSGVFPPSYFIWLKPRDRSLWYILNCVGRQVSFVEVAGIFGHWRAEQVAKHKLEVPFVSKAVMGLEIALREVKLPNT